MAAKLKSASINQTLKLALRVLPIALVALWMRAAGGTSLIVGLLFLALYIFSYTRITLHAKRFFPSALALVALAFWTPKVGGAPEALFISIWGILYFLLLSIKNLIIVRRQEVYRFLHLVLIAAISTLFFVSFSLTSQIILFIAYIVLFKEFYTVLAPKDDNRITLIASTESFLAIQVAWAASFLSINFLSAAALLTLYIYIFHDTAIHSLSGKLSSKVIIRNTLVFGILAALILALSL